MLCSLRDAAGYSQEEAARHIGKGYDKTRVSKLENGRLGVTQEALTTMLDLYNVTDVGKREVLLKLARDGARRGWWQTYKDIISPAYAELIGMEADAEGLDSYQTLLIPGLAQTAAYARSSIRAINMRSTPQQVDALVEVRMARQAVLSRPEPLKFWAIIHEAALRPKLNDARIMREQLQRLLDLMDLPHVSIQVLPSDAPEHPGMAGPFTILRYPESADLDVVLVEHLASALYVEDAADVAVYGSAFEHLRAHALPFAASADLTARLMKDLK
jgi:transcriptional regulator with XRE-family HTH domain